MVGDPPLFRITRRLSREVAGLSFSEPVTHVYNPLRYASKTHFEYLSRYGRGRREIILLGMNPGPWGMAQTGVPFGEVESVREWMRIEGLVRRPRAEHSKRPVEGFACRRSEVSGRRLWGWARDRFTSPERFFARFFVANYCPLIFLEASGRNRTPDKLPSDERKRLFGACDRALLDMIKEMRPQYLLGIGKFAEKRLRSVVTEEGVDVLVSSIPHPSPASPLANRGWAQLADRAFADLGISIRQ